MKKILQKVKKKMKKNNEKIKIKLCKNKFKKDNEENINKKFFIEGKINKMYYVNRWDPEEEDNESETFRLRNIYVKEKMAIIMDKIIENTCMKFAEIDWQEWKGLASEYYEYYEHKYPSLEESNNMLIDQLDKTIEIMAKKDDELVEIIEQMEKIRDKKVFSKINKIDERNKEIEIQLRIKDDKELRIELEKNIKKKKRLKKKDERTVLDILHLDRQCEEMWEIRKWLKERKKQLLFENHMEWDRESVKDNINTLISDAFYRSRRHLLPPGYVIKHDWYWREKNNNELNDDKFS